MLHTAGSGGAGRRPLPARGLALPGVPASSWLGADWLKKGGFFIKVLLTTLQRRREPWWPQPQVEGKGTEHGKGQLEAGRGGWDITLKRHNSGFTKMSPAAQTRKLRLRW
ncbi:max dimerization protein 4 [Platysternon megacephalum]|uniref:Max dimerization protein 4 n=1 Tax=Platysternon megacephalum TaxID=55544 RepID=A0A4D9EGQ2_9SAUR|nr:max dimerization protein 4 [Platysternon megacephalum]